MIKKSDLLQFWGKTEPYNPLLYHMVDVGHVGQELLKTSVFTSIKKQLLTNMGCLEPQLENWIGYLLSMHDIGKCHPEFQAKAPNLIGGLENLGLIFPKESIRPYYHSILSGNWLKNHLKELKWGRTPIMTVSNSILGHHGMFTGEKIVDHQKIIESWEPYRNEFKNLLFAYFQPKTWVPENFKDNSSVGLLLSGLLVLSDWIASNDKLFNRNKESETILDIEKYFFLSKKTAKIAIESLGFNYSANLSDFINFSDIWSNFTSLTSVQQICKDNLSDLSGNNLIIIEAPMGEGKTEAALYLSMRLLKNWKGFYSALPTMATSNQMYKRIYSFLHRIVPTMKENLQLVHGMSWMIDKFSHENTSLQEDAYDWFKPKKRSLLAPFGVGTIDQCLMSVLWVKFGFLRLLGLAGKTLIIDEVHAYDAYMSSILTRLLNWAFILQIPVILLSATLPLSKKKALVQAYSDSTIKNNDISNIFKQENNSYPLITVKDSTNSIRFYSTKESHKKKKISVYFEINKLEKFEEIADLAISSALKDKCVCLMLNTVKNSQKVYQILEEKCRDKNNEIILKLFHARFPIKQRLRIENEVLEMFDKHTVNLEMTDPENSRPKRTILVSTQVVEQSLDLDFDEFISEVAPIDLLIQRMGRLHRHSRPNRPCGNEIIFRILLPFLHVKKSIYFRLTELIYHRYILLKTVKTLIKRSNSRKHMQVTFPTDIKPLIEEVYSEKNVTSGAIPDDDLNKSYEKMIQKLEQEINEAKTYLIPPPNKKRFEFSQIFINPFGEDEGNAAHNFFYAKTRIGNLTRRVLLIDDPSLESIIDNNTSPYMKIQKKLMENSVNLPQYWFKDCKSELKTVKWLSNCLAIVLHDNKFEYEVVKNSSTVKRIIINHPIYGVQMEENI